MDALVAEEVMGAYVRQSDEGLWDLVIPGGVNQVDFVSKEGIWGASPRFSTDIAAAYQMEERIAELGLIEKYCSCLASIVWPHQSHPAPLPLTWYVIHATPEDRCRAALMAVEKD